MKVMLTTIFIISAVGCFAYSYADKLGFVHQNVAESEYEIGGNIFTPDELDSNLDEHELNELPTSIVAGLHFQWNYGKNTTLNI